MAIQNKILQECFDSFMKFGIKSVSMDDIARNLGMSKKTIYGFYDKKEALVRKVVLHFVEKDENEVEVITKNSKDAIDEIISIARHVIKMFRTMSPNALYDLKKYYPDVFNIIDVKHYRFIYNCIKTNLTRGIEEGYYRADINVEIVSKFYVGLSHLVVDQDEFSLIQYERSELFTELIRYHLNGILSEKGKKYLLNKEII